MICLTLNEGSHRNYRIVAAHLGQRSCNDGDLKASGHATHCGISLAPAVSLNRLQRSLDQLIRKELIPASPNNRKLQALCANFPAYLVQRL